MEHLAYRALYKIISENTNLAKQIACLVKIKQIYYCDRSRNSKDKATEKDKRTNCYFCSSNFQHVFMLIMHLEVVHPGAVDKYQVKLDSIEIGIGAPVPIPKDKEKGDWGFGFIGGLMKKSLKFPNSQGYKLNQDIEFESFDPAFLKNRHETRVKVILVKVLGKISKQELQREHTYFHSTNIFKKIDPNDNDIDSDDEIGEIQRQLQKLRIEEFSDVNDNDKKFFIEWNGFIHERRKKFSIIFAHDMPKIFIEFSAFAEKKAIPRINLVMHAWTLWSVGQIGPDDVLRGLAGYDQSAKERKEKQAQSIAIQM